MGLEARRGEERDLRVIRPGGVADLRVIRRKGL